MKKIVKTSKNCYFGAQLPQKGVSMGYTQLKIRNKRKDHQLSETLFYQNIIYFGWVMNLFVFYVMFFRWGTHLYISLFPSICLLHTISQEPDIIWSWFLVHICKMMISPDFFFIFLKFDFLGKWAKNSPKWKIRITSVTCHISGTV